MATKKPTTPAADAEPMTADRFLEWVEGALPSTRSVRLYARADILAEVDDLTRQLRIAESVPAGERGLTDANPASLRARLDALSEEFEASSITVKVRGRSGEANDRIEKAVKERDPDADEEEVIYHQLAEAITEPANISVATLKRLSEVSQPQMNMLVAAWVAACREAPKVDPTTWQRGSEPGRRASR